MCSALSIGKSMFIVHLIPEYRGATQSCKLLLYRSCDLTQWGPLPPFSLTFGSSSLPAEEGHHNLGLSWVVLASIHMVEESALADSIIRHAGKKLSSYNYSPLTSSCEFSFLKKILSLLPLFAPRDYSSPLKLSSPALYLFLLTERPAD